MQKENSFFFPFSAKAHGFAAFTKRKRLKDPSNSSLKGIQKKQKSKKCLCISEILCNFARLNEKRMNFEEMLNAQENVANHQVKMPLGIFFRKQIDRKYRYVVDLKPELTDSIVFCEALKKEQQWSLEHKEKVQLHYELHEDSNSISELELEPGNYQTLDQLLEANPAIVADNNFVRDTVRELMEYTSKLNQEGVQHLCFAPKNVFVRKGDNMPMLLCHGSFYTGLSDIGDLYNGFEEFVAPEVLAHETVDERSDVYSLGKLIEYIFAKSSMPYEYKQVVKKATAQDPAKRFKTIDEMRNTLKQKRFSRHSVLMFALAIGIALLGIYLYFDMMPPATYVEYVEPVPKAEEKDPFDEPYDLGMTLDDDDSLGITENDLMRKAQDIYRKRYQKEADAILDKVYNDDDMNASEKVFKANSQAMVEELMKAQKRLAEEAGISEEEAGRIGQEVFEKLSSEKQQRLERKGYIKGSKEEE